MKMEHFQILNIITLVMTIFCFNCSKKFQDSPSKSRVPDPSSSTSSMMFSKSSSVSFPSNSFKISFNVVVEINPFPNHS